MEMFLLVVYWAKRVYCDIANVSWRISKEVEDRNSIAAVGPGERILDQVEVFYIRNTCKPCQLCWVVQPVIAQV